MTVKKLYEAKDASINVSVEFKPSRFLFGFAYTEAPFTREVRMRMVALHLWCLCLTFTRFSIQQATAAEIEREARMRGRDLGKGPKEAQVRSATRQSGKARRKRR